MQSNSEFNVEVVDSSTDEVVKTLHGSSERVAARIERGLNINLNHAKYHTRLVPVVDEARA